MEGDMVLTDHNISRYIPYDKEKEKYEACKMFDPKKNDNRSTIDCPDGYVHKGDQGPTIVTEVGVDGSIVSVCVCVWCEDGLPCL